MNTETEIAAGANGGDQDHWGSAGVAIVQGGADVGNALATLEDYAAAGKYNVLAPVLVAVQGGATSPYLVEAVTVVSVSPTKESGEVYNDFRYANEREGKFALTSLALSKISAAAGVKWIPEHCKILVDERRPDGHRQIVYQAAAGIRTPTGEWHVEIASKEIDTADVEEQLRDADRRTYKRTAGNSGGSVPAWVKNLGAKATPEAVEEAITDRVRQQLLQQREHLLSHAECVPLDAEILTTRGWKRHDEILVGEPVLAYDVETDTTRWVPLQDVTTYPPAPTVEISSRGFRARCTPDHSWAVRDAWGEGAKKHRRSLIKALDLTRYQRQVVLAASAPGGDSPLTEQQAALLGWIATDGTIRYHDVGRWGPYVRVHIVQSKYTDEIRALLPEGSFSEYLHPARARTFPTGRTYETKPCVQFQLRTKLVKELLETAGIKDKGDLPHLIPLLSQPARAAMLDAMLKGDGTLAAGRHWVFAQRPGPVLDAFQMLATLEGKALGLARKNSVVVEQAIRDRRHVNGPNLAISAVNEEPVWCPTTPLGTWVMRLDGQVTITGNTKAKSRAIRRILSLRQVYTKAELSRPFAVPRLVYRPDFTNPLELERVQVEGREAASSVFGDAPESHRDVAVAELPAETSDTPAPGKRDAGSPREAREEAVATASGASTGVASEGAKRGEATASPGRPESDPLVEGGPYNGQHWSEVGMSDPGYLRAVANESRAKAKRDLANRWLAYYDQ